MRYIVNNDNYIVIERESSKSIAVFLFNTWNGTINSVIVDKSATHAEIDILRKIAYGYSEKIYKRRSNNHVRYEMHDIFKKVFDDYLTEPSKEQVHEIYFTDWNGKFIINSFESDREVLDEIIKQIKEQLDCLVSIDITIRDTFIERMMYTVTIDENLNREFTFWKAIDWPVITKNNSWSFHIVPDYHPSSPSQGCKISGLLINGATNALISSKTISSVYSPAESRINIHKSGWEEINHPCKAAGKSFQFTLGGYYQLTKELVDDAVKLIVASLGVGDNEYVGVSQGFYPPYDFPENISNRTGRELPCKDRPRGSEKHCMWMYDVLKEEGCLESAYVPDWFYAENWVEFFKDQKGVFPKFGLKNI